MDGRVAARAALLAALLIPPSLLRRGPTLCMFRRLTGRPCPSCGMTRSWNAVAHLRLREGFAFHAFGPPTFLAAVLLAVLPRVPLPGQLWIRSPRVVVGVAAIWLADWLRRLVASGPERAD